MSATLAVERNSMSEDRCPHCGASLDPKILEGRRRVVAILDELRGVGLLRYSLAPPEMDGLEPRLEVWADRDALNQSAWGTGVSREAARIWDALRAGTFRIAPTLQPILNVLEGARR